MHRRRRTQTGGPLGEWQAGSNNLKPSLEARLSSQQAEGLSLNIALLLLLGNRREAAASLLRSLSKRQAQPSPVTL